MTHVYAYVRVSTGRQAEDGESLAVQRRQIEGYAKMLGLTIDRVFVEKGVSGSKPLAERPEGAKLLATIKNGDTIVAAKLDRMFRSARDALDVGDRLRSRGISLHFIDLGGDVTGNGIGKLVFTILAAVAEAERDRIRERVREVKADQKRRKRYLGGKVPFGFRVKVVGDEKYLVDDPDTRKIAATARDLRATGMSIREVARRTSIPTMTAWSILKHAPA